MTHGRKDRAIKELRRAARVNERMVHDDLLNKVKGIKYIWPNPIFKLYPYPSFFE